MATSNLLATALNQVRMKATALLAQQCFPVCLNELKKLSSNLNPPVNGFEGGMVVPADDSAHVSIL